MTLSDLANIGQAVEGAVTLLAAVCGGIWAVWWHFRRRDASGHFSLDVEARVVGQVGHLALCDATVRIVNSGKVRAILKSVSVEVTGARAAEILDTTSQSVVSPFVEFQTSLARGNLMATPSSSPRGETFVDPGVECHFHTLLRIPMGFDFVCIRAAAECVASDDIHYDSVVCRITQVEPAIDSTIQGNKTSDQRLQPSAIN